MCCQTLLAFGEPSLCSYNGVAQIGPTGLALGYCWKERQELMLCKCTKWMKYRWREWKQETRETRRERRSRWRVCETERKAPNTVTADATVRCSCWQHVWKHSSGRQQQLLWGGRVCLIHCFCAVPDSPALSRDLNTISLNVFCCWSFSCSKKRNIQRPQSVRSDEQ